MSSTVRQREGLPTSVPADGGLRGEDEVLTSSGYGDPALAKNIKKFNVILQQYRPAGLPG
jgi:hypothetical protein